MADLTDISATTGIWCLTDFRPEMTVVSGRTKLLQRLVVRLQTARGRFPWWPNFGTDLRQFLLTKARASAIAAAAEAECLKDEQVDDVQARAEIQLEGKEIRLGLTVLDAEGPFSFTLQIEQAKLTLIELQAAA